MLPETGFIQVGENVTFQALHKSYYLILCKLPATLVDFTNVRKGNFPRGEGAGSINIVRIIDTKLGDFDGVARARRAHSLTQNTKVSVPRHTLCYTTDSCTYND